MSRTALSHLEAGMRVASERTVVILAGVFATPPHELVDGTSYPQAKSDRLPAIVALHTEVDLELALCQAELALLEQLADESRFADDAQQWSARLGQLAKRWPDAVDRRRLADARHAIAQQSEQRSSRPVALRRAATER